MTGQYQQGRGFTGNARDEIARALMQQGASTAPVRSPLEGIARALTGAAGGFFAGQARADQQKALADAMAALQDPAIPSDQRMTKAIEAAGDSPMGDQLRGIALSRLMPKEPASPLGKMWQDAQQLPADHPVRKMFETAIAKDAGDPAYLRQSEAAKGQGGYDAKIAGEPALINATAGPQANAAALQEQAKNPALIQRAGGTAQATANVDLRMKPQIEAATIAAATPGLVSRAGQTAEASAAGGNRGQMAPVATSSGPQPGVQAVAQATEAGQQAGKGNAPLNESERKWREEFKKPIDQAADLVNQRNIIKTSLAQGNGTGDIAAIVGFNKMLDPGAVVREADVQLTLAAQGLADRLNVWMSNKQEGDILPPALRQKMGELSDQIFKTSSDTIRARVLPYQSVIEGQGGKFGNVIPMDLQTTLGWTQGGAQQNAPQSSPQGLPRFKDDAASRLAYEKLPSGSAYHDEKGELRFKP